MDEAVKLYAQTVQTLHKTGNATEHTYRGALAALLEALLPAYTAVNEPARIECGAPDYALVGRKDRVPHAYVEAKDLFDGDLAGQKAKQNKPQFDRYKASLARVAFTDYLDFRFFVDGEETAAVRLLESDGKDGFRVANAAGFAAALRAWADCPAQPVANAKRLAEIMAYKTRLLADATRGVLRDGESGATHDLLEAFRDVLIHDLAPEDFADLYAQTIAYGMFAARLHDASPGDFSRQKAATLIPLSNPFLRRIFQHVAGFDLDGRIAWIVDDLAETFAASDMGRIMGDYRREKFREDPLIHFYEDFLAAYDPAKRKACGVYYTPQPVVRFIVRVIDDVLKRTFKLKSGLADDSKVGAKHRVQILDPATGTGTFLAETVRVIRERFKDDEGMWPGYVEECLKPRLHGFELLMAPYAITHLKLDLMLADGAPKAAAPDTRLRVYLTNSLEEGDGRLQNLPMARWLSDESNAANSVKHDCPVMVMMGNPPYSIASSNKSAWILKLIEDYKQGLDEKKLNLDDDYIKFIRLGQHYIDKNGSGVLGFITNNSYLDGLVHRRMRQSLLESFDDIYIVNLHGNSKRKETAPDGGKDESVFDITVGTAIAIFVKREKGRRKRPATVRYLDLYGRRKEKFAALDGLTLGNAPWRRLDPAKPHRFFVPKDFSLEDEYKKGLRLDELFPVHNSGVKTDRDSLFIDEDRDALTKRIRTLLSGSFTEDFARLYNVADSSSYKLTSAIRGKTFDEKCLLPIQYRPLDFRTVYYDPQILSRPAGKVARHFLLNSNVAIVAKRGFPREDAAPVWITDSIPDIRVWSCAGTQGSDYCFPLYLYDAFGRTSNIDTKLIGGRKPEEFFAYAYAVLHSPRYRARYSEFLKIDFPRIPLPCDETEYKRLVRLGRRLMDAHLMRTEFPVRALPKFPVAGSNEVDVPAWDAGRVRINATQYFAGVSEDVWNFYVGGYQPAQKWLKDRRGRTLTNADLNHYKRIVAALAATVDIMSEIG